MKSPIVVGVIEKQPHVLTYAIREALATNSPLHVVHSVGVSIQTADYYAGMEMMNALREAGQHVLDDAKDVIDAQAPSLETKFVLASGLPVQLLDQAAENARCVIIGSDDVPWFDRIMRSNVAGHLAKRAPCPVVVVPPHTYIDDYEGDIIVTIDGRTAARGPMRFAYEHADAHGAALHVLHVAPNTMTPEQADADKATVAEVLAGWADEYPDTTVITTYVAGDPAAAIVHATEAAGLVIVGRPRLRHPLSLAHLVATDVIRAAHCPVGVVPDTYPEHAHG